MVTNINRITKQQNTQSTQSQTCTWFGRSAADGRLTQSLLSINSTNLRINAHMMINITNTNKNPNNRSTQLQNSKTHNLDNPRHALGSDGRRPTAAYPINYI